MMVFPAMGADEVLAATRERWDLTGPLPVPLADWLVCPICGHDQVQPRYWRYHKRSGDPTVPYRCDVSFKCCSCAAVWVHGVALDAQTWAARPNPRLTGRQIHWHEAQRLLNPSDPLT